MKRAVVVLAALAAMTFGSMAAVDLSGIDDDGDFEVIILPESKEECREGRWRFSRFENQGQCMRYVNRLSLR